MALADEFDALIKRLERATRPGEVERAWEALSRFAAENYKAISIGLYAIDAWQKAQAEREQSKPPPET